MNSTPIRDIALAAHAAGHLTAFMLTARQGNTAFLAQFADVKAASAFARAQAVAQRRTIAVKRIDTHCLHVAIPCNPAHRPNAAAFTMHPAPEDEAGFLASLASAGLAQA